MRLNVETLEAAKRSFYELGRHMFMDSYFGIRCNFCGKTKYIEGAYLLKKLDDESYKCGDCIAREWNEKRKRKTSKKPSQQKPVVVNTAVKKQMERIQNSNVQYKTNMCYTNRIVVTMTSWQKRIKNCYGVVRSILNQTVPPDIIYLNLSSEEFKNKEDDLPKNLIELRDTNKNFIINWVDGENTKSMKKVFPILKFLEDDDILIDTDDDIIMPKDLIEARLNDFARTGKRAPVTSCKRKWDLGGVPCYIMSAWSVFQPKMLRGWENVVTKEVIKTYNDDRTYLLMMWLNGYKCVPCTKYDMVELMNRFTKNANDSMTNNKVHLVGGRYDKVVEPIIIKLFGKKISDSFGILKKKNEANSDKKIEQKIDFIIPYALSAKKADSTAMTKFKRLEIEYVLKSIRKFCPFAGRIFLATDSKIPERILDQVTVIKVGDPYAHIKDANIINKIKTVIEHVPDLSETFIMASDDQIVRKPSSLSDFNPRISGDLTGKLKMYELHARGNWQKCLALTMKKFKKRQYIYQPHIWSPMNKHKFIEMCKKYNIKNDKGIITQSLYYNFVGQPKTANYDHTYLSWNCTQQNINDAIKRHTRHLAWTDTAFKNKNFRDYLEKTLFGGSMKVAIYSPNIMKTYGGLERASYWLYNRLTLAGIDTTFLVFDYKKNEPERYKFESTPKNVIINPFKKDSMKKIMNDGGYNCVVVFASHPYTPYICDALKETKIPWVYAERTEPESLEKLYKRKFQNPKGKRLQIINNCSAMVLQIEEYSKSVPEERRRKLRIIPNTCAIKPDRERSTNQNKKILLSLGRLSDNQKQISMLINAFDIAVSGINDWELHIYGNGPNEAMLKQLANSKTNKSKIKFNGVSKHPSDQYSTSDVFCLPSKFEGFPNTVIEAFAHALPVIAFKECTAARNIVKDGYNGLLADKMDVNSLAEALKKVMSSNDLVNELSLGAKETSKKYNEDVIFNMWLDVINTAIANRINHMKLHSK